MTPEEHNKYLGISHLVYGGLMWLFGLGMMGFMYAMLRSGPGGPPFAPMIFMILFMGAIYGLMTIPSFVAAFGLLKKRRWAKTASIIGAVTAAMNFPIGTAVCAYTFWFLFSEPGKAIFDRPNYVLPPGRQAWASEVHDRHQQTEYVPPPSPPDWR